MQLDRIFLKKLWDGEKVMCPKCNKDFLVPLHKDNDDFKCPNCKEVYRTINIFSIILNSNK